nr:MAG TPA: hypothetical protein [Caudoviricetes sp.]
MALQKMVVAKLQPLQLTMIHNRLKSYLKDCKILSQISKSN